MTNEQAEILMLTRAKTRGLEAFLRATEEFRAQALQGNPETLYEGLETFDREREIALRSIQLFDGKASLKASRLPRDQREPSWIGTLREVVADQERILEQISRYDADITRLLESAQQTLQTELRAGRVQQRSVAKFKSEWMGRAGEGLDTKL